MLQPPTEGEFQTFELLWKHVHNVSRAQGYSVSTLKSNMDHNQIKIGCDRSVTPNTNKTSFKKVTSRNLDCPFRLYAREYDQWAYVRGDFAEETQQNQDLYEAMKTLIPSISSYLDRIEWYEDFGQALKSKWMSMPDMGDPIV
ncbi:hypothetical protein O181_099210 [Austropuccinia psidii MF-1]|uniref:Uncharacterized protein n=1 Tax=Austropuccinia psidii MF-1 TaxID=1389203 RepID=A0A9Q3JD60_9BASI|nr:hypothetical protein [Austropuccinia psidii MF-1]